MQRIINSYRGLDMMVEEPNRVLEMGQSTDLSLAALARKAANIAGASFGRHLKTGTIQIPGIFSQLGGQLFDALSPLKARELQFDMMRDPALFREIVNPPGTTLSQKIAAQHAAIVRRRRAPAYVAFDILDLRSLPLGERRRRLQGILPNGSAIISEALSVAGRGRELFELMREHDLEGIVAKRLDDPYDPRVRWLKIKNPDYSQKEGRGDLFNRSQHAAPSAD